MSWLNVFSNALALSGNSYNGGDIFDVIAGLVLALMGSAFFIVYLVIIITIVIGAVLFGLVIGFVLPGIFLYKLAKKVGYQKPWLAFIPYAQVYLIYILPEEKVYDVKLFKIQKRSTAALIGTLAPVALGFVMPALVVIDFIPIVGPLIYMVAVFVATYGIALYRLRANYDLYTWYFDNTASLVLAIVGVFVPLTFLVVLIIMSCKEPIYKDATPSTV